MATERSVVIFSQGTYGFPCTFTKLIYTEKRIYCRRCCNTIILRRLFLDGLLL